MKRSSIILLLAPFLLVAAVVGPAAAEFRVATVDMNRLINETPESAGMKKELDEKTLAARKKVDAKREALKSLEDKIKKSKLGEDSKEAEKFRQDAKDLARMVKDAREELEREYLKSNKALTEKVARAVREYADSHAISLVLDKSDKTRGPVLFGAASADITNEVMKQLH